MMTLFSQGARPASRGKSMNFGVRALLAALALFSGQAVWAHGGGLDSNGCHHDRKRGGYHCHRSSYVPSAVPASPPASNFAPATSGYRSSVPATFAPRSTLERSTPIRTLESAGLQSCRQHAISHVEQLQCLSDELDREKALLNVDYKILWRDADETSRAALDKAQKAWLTFRNLECEAKAQAIQGTVASDAQLECLLNHVVLRRAQLQNYFAL